MNKTLTTMLYRTKDDALEAATKNGRHFFRSTCDCGNLDTADNAPADAFGETNCYRTSEGDIFAYWEE